MRVGGKASHKAHYLDKSGANPEPAPKLTMAYDNKDESSFKSSRGRKLSTQPNRSDIKSWEGFQSFEARVLDLAEEYLPYEPQRISMMSDRIIDLFQEYRSEELTHEQCDMRMRDDESRIRELEGIERGLLEFKRVALGAMERSAGKIVNLKKLLREHGVNYDEADAREPGELRPEDKKDVSQDGGGVGGGEGLGEVSGRVDEGGGGRESEGGSAT